MKSKNSPNKMSRIVLALTMSVAAISNAEAAFVSYYVGVDTLPTLASGAYSGLSNPNFNRLTFLYAHPNEVTPSSSHYHSKGIQIYTGPNLGEGLTATTTSANNFLPEGSNPPIPLMFASGGIYDGKLASQSIAGNPFSFLTIEDTGKLAGFGAGTPEHFMFNSSSGRWNGILAGADVHLELVNLSAGLNIGGFYEGGEFLNLFAAPGDDLHLEDSFSFTPTFWTDADAAPGDYTAQFKLTDESDTFGESGTFEFRFTVVPEPSSALLGAVGALALLRRRR